MKIPNSGRKKALCVIDVQADFLDERSNYIVENIQKLLDKIDYDLYVEAVFYSEKGSLWDKQRHVIVPKGQTTHTIEPLEKSLSKLDAIKVKKQSRSIFKEDSHTIEKLLKEKEIEEVHFVGLQTNDCIFASVIEAFDLGFFAYAIEECCETRTKELQDYGIALLRRQHMTNNSIVEDVSFSIV